MFSDSKQQVSYKHLGVTSGNTNCAASKQVIIQQKLGGELQEAKRRFLRSWDLLIKTNCSPSAGQERRWQNLDKLMETDRSRELAQRACSLISRPSRCFLRAQKAKKRRPGEAGERQESAKGNGAKIRREKSRLLGQEVHSLPPDAAGNALGGIRLLLCHFPEADFDEKKWDPGEGTKTTAGRSAKTRKKPPTWWFRWGRSDAAERFARYERNISKLIFACNYDSTSKLHTKIVVIRILVFIYFSSSFCIRFWR